MARWRPSRTFRRYVALEAPGWAIAAAVLVWCVQSFGLDARLGALLFALWVGKDFVLFPLLRDAYEEGDPSPGAALVGRVAEARAGLERGPGHEGWVQLGSERWRAALPRGAAPVPPGAPVRVRAVRGLVLEVEPLDDAAAATPSSTRSPSGAR